MKKKKINLHISVVDKRGFRQNREKTGFDLDEPHISSKIIYSQ